MEVKARILDAIGQKTEEIGDGSTGTASFGFRYRPATGFTIGGGTSLALSIY